jgi:hypothetical protein
MSAAERQAAQAKGGRAALDAMLGQPFAYPSNVKPGPIFTSNVKVTMGPPESAKKSGAQASPQANIGKLPSLGEQAQWGIGNLNYSEGSRNTNSTINARPPLSGGSNGGAAIRSTATPALSSSTISGVAGSAGFDTSKMTKDMGNTAYQYAKSQTPGYNYYDSKGNPQLLPNLGPNMRSAFPGRRVGGGTR